MLLSSSENHEKIYGSKPVCSFCLNESIIVLSDVLSKNKIAYCGKHTVRLIQEISEEARNHANQIKN